MTARAQARQGTTAVTFTGRAEQAIRRAVTGVVFTVAGLTFAFGFSNGLNIGLQLGLPGWSAVLVAPAVDLSVVALLAAMQYLRAHGVDGKLIGPRVLLVFCGVVTLGLNVAYPMLAGEYGLAAFHAIPPLLLVGWSEVGPRLLAALHGTNAGPSPTVQDDVPTVPPELVARARQLDAAHRQEHRRPITRDRLRAGLKVSNAVAGEVLRHIRAHAHGRRAMP